MEAEGERGSPRIKAEMGKEEERTENGPAAQRQTSNFQVSAPGSVEGLRLGPANHTLACYFVCEEDPNFFGKLHKEGVIIYQHTAVPVLRNLAFGRK